MANSAIALENAEHFNQLETVFRELFDSYDGEFTPDLTANDVDQWDSLGHIQLIVMIEQVWNIKFTNDEATTLANIGELTEMISIKSTG